MGEWLSYPFIPSLFIFIASKTPEFTLNLAKILAINKTLSPEWKPASNRYDKRNCPGRLIMLKGLSGVQ